MNPFLIFNQEEKEKIIKNVTNIENREYTNEEWRKLENKVIRDIVTNSYKNGDVDKARIEFDSIISKIEKCINK